MTSSLLDFASARTRIWILVALIATGAFLRVHGLDSLPHGVQQDELSDIYDGYSIMRTGADRFGDRFPLVVRGFGENDYRPALYPWLAAVPQAFTGFSIAAGRLPSAVLGTASLFLIFVFARRMAGIGFAFAALLLAALSPIHIQFSRLAHEGAMLPAFFFALILYLWQKAAIDGYRARTLVLLGLSTGLATSSYQATRLNAFLFAIVIAIDILRYASRRIGPLSFFSAAAFGGAIPQIIVLVSNPARFFARVRALGSGAEGPVGIAREIVTDFWLNIEPRWLFWPGDIIDLTVARLLPPELPFFYIGLVALALMRLDGFARSRTFIYMALLIAVVPGALTPGNPNPLRASGFIVLSPFFSAAGLVVIGRMIRNERLRNHVYYPVSVTLLIASAAALVWWYARSTVYKEAHFQQVLVDLGKKLPQYERNVDEILLERYGTQMYIYIAAFRPFTPEEFQRGPKSFYSIGMDEFTSLGKYRIIRPEKLDSAIAASRARRIIAVSPTIRPGMQAVDSVSYWAEKLYIQAHADRSFTPQGVSRVPDV